MRITYISSSYVPSRRASALHVMKMCSAFGNAGHAVDLIVKKNDEHTEANVEDVFRFYDVDESFEIVPLSRPSGFGGGLVYSAGLMRFLRDRRNAVDLVYSRDLVGGFLAARIKIPFVFEVHGVPSTRRGRAVLRSISGSPFLKRLVSISSALLRDLRSQGLAPESEEKTVVVHDAADRPKIEKSDERLLAENDGGGLHIGYVGNLYPGRGIELIAAIAKSMPDIAFHIVGGSTSDLTRWKRSAIPSNLIFHGFVAPKRVPGILREFDILLMPHQRIVLAATGRSDISRWTSPLKMFEYMASRTPIIASRLPVLQEILEDGRNSLLVAPDDVGDWIAAIRRLEADPGLGARLSQTAFVDFISEHTWTRRVEKVISGLRGSRSDDRRSPAGKAAEIRDH